MLRRNAELLVRLGVQQLTLPIPTHYVCKIYSGQHELRPAKGQVYFFDSYLTINYGDGVAADSQGAVYFEPSVGNAMKVLLPDLRLTVSNFSGANLAFNFCKA